MRKRNHVIPIRLNTKEMKHLETQVAVSGLNREEYLRTLILGAEVRAKPCTHHADLLRKVAGLCNNANQLAHVANATGTASQESVNENAEDIQKSLGRSKGNVVMTYCIYKYYSRSPPGPFCRLYPG